MSTPARRPGPSVAVWLAVALAASGGICIVAGLLTAFVVAGHSSSDSSPSSVIAIGLAGLGVLAVVLGALLLGGVALTRLWRRARRPPRAAAPDRR